MDPKSNIRQKKKSTEPSSFLIFSTVQMDALLFHFGVWRPKQISTAARNYRVYNNIKT